MVRSEMCSTGNAKTGESPSSISAGSEPDLICIGGGIAGLTAAARAAELGLKVLVLEQGADADYPCNSRYCYGIIHAAHHDLKRPAAELRHAIRQVMGDRTDEELTSAVAEDGGRLIDWLRRSSMTGIMTSPS